MKRLLILLLLLFLLPLLSRQVRAQGFYGCAWVSSAGVGGICQGFQDCEPGNTFYPENIQNCNSFAITECNQRNFLCFPEVAGGTFTCNWDGTGCRAGSRTNDCELTQGEVEEFCDSASSETACNAWEYTPCVQSPITTPPPGPTEGCGDGVEEEGFINTAIGCIPYNDASALASFILRWAVGIGGGIAFILMVYAGFLIITSTGNPQRLQAGKELLTAAVSGLLLLVFSVFLLRIIGVDILGLPGL